MEPTAIVDLLRKTLLRHGHIVPTKSQLEQKCLLLNQGEYLVSILSQDEEVMDFIRQAGEGNLIPLSHDDDVQNRGLPLKGVVSRDFNLYVDVVKFVWLLHGATAAIQYCRNVGLYRWSRRPIEARHKHVDGLVLIGQRRLRKAGVKHSDYAQFFQDAGVAVAFLGYLVRHDQALVRHLELITSGVQQ